MIQILALSINYTERLGRWLPVGTRWALRRFQARDTHSRILTGRSLKPRGARPGESEDGYNHLYQVPIEDSLLVLV